MSSGDEARGGEVLFSPEPTRTAFSTAKDGQGDPQFVLEYPVFPPSSAQKGKNSAKNAKNKQAKRLALAMASVFGWMVASADISTAFLYAALHQDD
eukprot:2424044-Amphidinium_carterae.1